MGQFFKAAKASDVASGKLRCVELAGKRIALFSLGEEIYALGDLCAHETGRLTQATMNSGEVENPLRQKRFGVETGHESSLTDIPTSDSIERYNVRVQDGDVEIEIQ